MVHQGVKMLKKEFLDDDYNRFQRHMLRSVHGIIVDKKDNVAVEVVANILDTIRLFAENVPSGDEWKTRYSFTFGPFVLLADGMIPSHRAQVLTHECQHVLQWYERTPQADVPNHVQMQWLYLVEQEARVRLEVEAYRAGAEVMWAMEGLLMPSEAVASVLEGGYLITHENAEFARNLFKPAEVTIPHGIASTKAGRIACQWLSNNGYV